MLRYFSPAFLTKMAIKVRKTQLPDTFRQLLRSKTLVSLLCDDSGFDFLAFQQKFDSNEEFLTILLEFDLIYHEKEAFSQRKIFEFSSETAKNTFFFFTKTLVFFIRNFKEIDSIYLHYTEEKSEKTAEKIFENYGDSANFNVLLKGNTEKISVFQWEFAEMPEIHHLKLFFKNFDQNAENLLEILNFPKISAKTFENLKGFYLTIKQKNPQKTYKIQFPVAFLSEKLEKIFIKLTKLDFSNEKNTFFKDIFAFFDRPQAVKSLKSLDFIVKSLENVDFHKELKRFFTKIRIFSHKLSNFSLQIPGFCIKDDDFSSQMKTLNFSSLKTINFDFDQTGISHKTLMFIKNFLENQAQNLEKFGIILRNNKISDSGLCNLWSSFTTKTTPNMKEIRLYLQNNQFSHGIFREIIEALSCFPEKITYFKVDLEGNRLGIPDKNVKNADFLRNFGDLGKSLSGRLKSLKFLQFHLRKCHLGRSEIFEFLKGICQIPVNCEVFCDLSLNKDFWEEDWEENEVKIIEERLCGICAKKVKIFLKMGKNYKVDERVLKAMKRIKERIGMERGKNYILNI